MTMRNINEYLLSKKHPKTNDGIQIGDVVHISYCEPKNFHIVVGKKLGNDHTLFVINLFKDPEEYTTHEWESDLSIINWTNEDTVDKVIKHHEFSKKELDMFENTTKNY